MAEWIITFDDGPLPSDVTTYEAGDEAALLAPLDAILHTLETHPDGPIPAVFFLRGPAYPWAVAPPRALFQEGVNRILASGRHRCALHCFRHDPDLWWNWLTRAADIRADLDACLNYFQPMVPTPLRLFRPPYGQGGPPGEQWAADHNIRHRRWDIDPEDWLHHPDVQPLLRRFTHDNESGAHLQHMVSGLPWRMWLHTWWPGANDFLLHVSRRTAANLPRIIDQIVQVTRLQLHAPQFVIPDAYLHL